MESKVNQRYERKYLIPPYLRYDINSIIPMIPSGFKEIYKERIVNSIYFDTCDFDLFRDSLAGSCNRSKIRIRWYGSFYKAKTFTLEIKSKIGLLGSKILRPIPIDNIKLNDLKSLDFCALLRDKLEYHLNNLLPRLEPKLLCSYKRRYYQSLDNKFRITLDRELAFRRLDCLNSLLSLSSSTDPSIILELKYDANFDDTAYFIANHIPARLTRFSKYTYGIEQVFSS